MQAHGCVMDLHAFWNILQIFCIIQYAFMNILEQSACILEHFGTFCYYIKCCNVRRWNFNFATDGHTLGLVELRLRS